MNEQDDVKHDTLSTAHHVIHVKHN